MFNLDKYSDEYFTYCLSNRNSIRLGGPDHRIVNKTVYKTLPRGGNVKGVGGSRVMGSRR